MRGQNSHSEAYGGSQRAAPLTPDHPSRSQAGFLIGNYPSPSTWHRMIRSQFHCPAPPLLRYNTASISLGFKNFHNLARNFPASSLNFSPSLFLSSRSLSLFTLLLGLCL